MMASVEPTAIWKAARVVGRRRPVRSSSSGSSTPASATSSASNSRGAGRGGGVVGFVLGAVQREPQAQDGAGGLADAAEHVLDGDRGARQVVLVAVAEQAVAYVGDGRAGVVGGATGDQHVQGVEVAAQGDGRGVLGRHLVLRRGGQRRLGQVQGQGVGALGGARVEQQDAQPLGGDLGVGDAALEQ